MKYRPPKIVLIAEALACCAVFAAIGVLLAL